MAFWSVRKSRGVLWTPRYFARSVGGAPLSVFKQYTEGRRYILSLNTRGIVAQFANDCHPREHDHSSDLIPFGCAARGGRFSPDGAGSSRLTGRPCGQL
jgi:hypothetical protein